jgi:hypothetical protein
MTNWISPIEAMTTPITMKEMFPSVLRLTGATPRPQVVMRTATGMVAYKRQQSPSCHINFTYLEHLNKSHAQVQVGLVTADQAHAEEDTDGDNGPEVYAASHGHLLSRVEDGGEAGEDLGHDCRKDQMPCREEDGVVFCTVSMRCCCNRVRADVRNFALSRMYLLKTIVLELSVIHVLRSG